VIGLEGDIAWAHLSGKADDPFSSSSSNFVRANSQWLASVTGRVGFSALLPQTLIYAKGGVAWVHDKFEINSSVGGLDGELDKTRTGWTVGGGIAWAFARNWSVFAEYNHYDFRNTVLSNSVDFGVPVGTVEIKITPGSNIDTVKVGLNYQFGG